jgi:glycosyltransferase involved in cell wall biosynthesis
MSQLVSVALCTYNGARFIRQQMDSILVQTHRHIEVLAADDGSTDDTVAILQEYAASDARVRVFVNPLNMGFKRNFEQIMSQCSGAFIAPSDQDDVWLPEKLETMLGEIGDRPMVYCDGEFVDAMGLPFGMRVSHRLKLVGVDDPLALVPRNCVSGHAMLFRRDLLNFGLPFPESFPYHDWWLAAAAAANGGVVYCDKPLVGYRLHASNLTDMLGLRASSIPKDEALGRKAKDWKTIGDRLESLANIPGDHQAFISQLCRLWRDRDSQWLSVRLAWLMIQHGGRLRQLVKPVKRGLCWRNAHYAIGLKAKRFFKVREYS